MEAAIHVPAPGELTQAQIPPDGEPVLCHSALALADRVLRLLFSETREMVRTVLDIVEMARRFNMANLMCGPCTAHALRLAEQVLRLLSAETPDMASAVLGVARRVRGL